GVSSDLVRYSVLGGIAELMLDRAPVNALSMPLIDTLLAALTRARDDETVRAVIIGSARKVFCAGLDLDLVRGKPGIETKKFLEKLYFALNDMQYRMGKPTIAAVDGAVRAGGMTIAISCDMMIAGDASTFGYPEIDVGLPFILFSCRGWSASIKRSGRCFSAIPSMPRPRIAWACSARSCQGYGARSRPRGKPASGGQIPEHHEDRPRRLHARYRCRFPPFGRECRRELRSRRDHR